MRTLFLTSSIRILFVSLFAYALLEVPVHAADVPTLVRGGTLYVPVYSQVLHGNIEWSKKPSEKPLSVMLSIRNTDPRRSMTIRAIRYYDTDGRLVREYSSQSKTLGPFASTTVFVEHKDVEGGTGANFVVEWDAPEPLNAPIIETVHTYFFGNSSMVFVSPSQILNVQP
jgi:hypothetical protein